MGVLFLRRRLDHNHIELPIPRAVTESSRPSVRLMGIDFTNDMCLRYETRGEAMRPQEGEM